MSQYIALCQVCFCLFKFYYNSILKIGTQDWVVLDLREFIQWFIISLSLIWSLKMSELKLCTRLLAGFCPWKPTSQMSPYHVCKTSDDGVSLHRLMDTLPSTSTSCSQIGRGHDGSWVHVAHSSSFCLCTHPQWSDRGICAIWSRLLRESGSSLHSEPPAQVLCLFLLCQCHWAENE